LAEMFFFIRAKSLPEKGQGGKSRSFGQWVSLKFNLILET
jgi:hypothetical protein